jgi:hypothetical protein
MRGCSDRLVVEAAGRAVFLPVADMLADDHWDPDAELRRLNSHYRAGWSSPSADWEAANGGVVATCVFTTWLPSCETPRLQPRDRGVLLDMIALAESTAPPWRPNCSCFRFLKRVMAVQRIKTQITKSGPATAAVTHQCQS